MDELFSGCERFCSRLHKALEEESSQMPLWESSEVSTYLNALKMHVYLLVQMSELYQSSSQQNSASNAMVSPIKSKRKTKSKSTAGHLGRSTCNDLFTLVIFGNLLTI